MKYSQALVSVLVAVFNVKEYLELCINSIMEQSYSALEIIIVDDGSNDGSEEMCDVLSTKDNRISVYHKQNGGLVSARKYGLDKAHGEYVLFVDGDDSIKYDMIEKLYQRALETNADVVQCGFERSDGQRHLYPDFTETLSNEKRVEIIEHWLMEEPSFDSQCVTKLCKADMAREAYSKVSENCSYGEDMLFFIELVRIAKTISSLNCALYEYRIREGSLSHLEHFDIQYLIDNDRVMNILLERIAESFPCVSESRLQNWYLNNRAKALGLVLKSNYNHDIYKYDTGLEKMLEGLKVVVYGAGAMGRDIIAELSKSETISIVMWLDQNAEKISVNYRKIYKPEEIRSVDFDKVVIALADEKKAEEVAEIISEKYKIPMEKLIWKYNRVKTLK